MRSASFESNLYGALYGRFRRAESNSRGLGGVEVSATSDVLADDQNEGVVRCLAAGLSKLCLSGVVFGMDAD